MSLPLNYSLNYDLVKRNMDLFDIMNTGREYEIVSSRLGSLTDSKTVSDGQIIVKYPSTLYTFRVRVSIKNELNDSRLLVIRQLNVFDEKSSQVPYKYMACSAGWNKQYSYIDDGNLFTDVPLIRPPMYKQTGVDDQAVFIGPNKYMKIKSNSERTIDLEFKQRSSEVRFMCTDYDCNLCKSVQLTTYDLSKLHIEFLYDKPDLDDLSETEMIEKVSKTISEYWYSISYKD